MMQFTETPPPPPPLYQISTFTTLIPMTKTQIIHRSRPWPIGFPTPAAAFGAGGNSGLGDANCMEQLLVQCATAIEANDATLAQQILWVLNNIAPPDGDSTQRLASAFLRALISRAAKSGTCMMLAAAVASSSPAISTHKFSVTELASFVDLTPWHRFGFTAANSAILDAVEGFSIIHIVDLSLTHCMQIPTLIDAVASRLAGPPLIKLTVAGATEDIPPMLDLSYDELGAKLVNFAQSKNVNMEFRVIPSSCTDGFSSFIEEIRSEQLVRGNNFTNEALVVNCHMMLHYIPEGTLSSISSFDAAGSPNSSYRTTFLKNLRRLDPTAVVLVDEDADFTSNDMVSRLKSAFNYLWIPYDTMDTFLLRGRGGGDSGGSKEREWYEGDLCWKIENVVAQEGAKRVERAEPKGRWAQRMRNAGFRGAGFSEDGVAEVKGMLEEHAAGWGLKREEEDLVLTWKGHNVVFATVWVPTS
ncbi:scarecrow-like protein 32 [Rhododendron vialii]|uniref:scarecrow-like protein 32 n=1 Tax=Rhododendron vialii TaxID=182163 RepID=UPI00265E9889|nr:scarecrow-like protein 32 [Rhododendron vialii]